MNDKILFLKQEIVAVHERMVFRGEELYKTKTIAEDELDERRLALLLAKLELAKYLTEEE